MCKLQFASESEQPRLWWSNDVTPHAVVDVNFNADRIAGQALRAFVQWRLGPALSPRKLDGSALPRGDELKFSPPDIRAYLSQAEESDPNTSLATALVAEGSLDGKGEAKPSDLYFTAGQQKFLAMARQVLDGATRHDVLEALNGPWPYKSKLPSLMWDISDDSVYALTAADPSGEKKLTNPGRGGLGGLGSEHTSCIWESRQNTDSGMFGILEVRSLQLAPVVRTSLAKCGQVVAGTGIS